MMLSAAYVVLSASTPLDIAVLMSHTRLCRNTVLISPCSSMSHARVNTSDTKLRVCCRLFLCAKRNRDCAHPAARRCGQPPSVVSLSNPNLSPGTSDPKNLTNDRISLPSRLAILQEESPSRSPSILPCLAVERAEQ